MNNNTFLKILLAVSFCAAMLNHCPAQDIKFTEYWSCLINGTIYQDSQDMDGWSSSVECPSHHLDPTPDHKPYTHGHPGYDFTFPYDVIINGQLQTVQITATGSDAAWATVYVGYSGGTGSTLANCYAMADGSPVPTDPYAWDQWTTSYTLCSGASAQTSTLVNGGSPLRCIQRDRGGVSR